MSVEETTPLDEAPPVTAPKTRTELLQQRLNDSYICMQKMFDITSDKLKELFFYYEAYITKDATIPSRVEYSFRALSYILPMRFNTTVAVSEFIYFLSSALRLTHDLMYRRKYKIQLDSIYNLESCLQGSLTVLENMQSFLELGATAAWGDVGKWLVLSVVQIVKVLLKFILLWKFNAGLYSYPPLPTARREKAIKQFKAGRGNVEEETTSPACKVKEDGDSLEIAWKEAIECNQDIKNKNKSTNWVSTKSGRLVRPLNQTVDLSAKKKWNSRLKQDFESDLGHPLLDSNLSCDLSFQQKLGEVLYSVRPLVHLFSMLTDGETSWKPYSYSLMLDLASIYLVEDKKKRLLLCEQDEVYRRKMSMLVYLLRSPFYEKFSHAPLLTVLKFIQDWVPLSGNVVGPLRDYLPYWRSIYSHCWSN